MCHFDNDRIEIGEYEREFEERQEGEPEPEEPERPAVMADGGDEDD